MSSILSFKPIPPWLLAALWHNTEHGEWPHECTSMICKWDANNIHEWKQPIVCTELYSGTSIIQTSFIRHLNYPDMLNSAKYINTHAQRTWPMTFWGCGHISSRSLETYPGQNWLICVVVWTLLTMIILHRYHLKTRHHISQGFPTH